MTREQVSKPPLSKVAAALRETTETLAAELDVSTSDAPFWTDFEWNIARAVAAMHGVSVLLDNALRWQGPEIWQRFLREQRYQSVARYLKIADLLDAIDSQARCEGVPLVALKGAALHASGLYEAGERPMGDIDLLIRPEDADTISLMLAVCGYAPAFTTHRHQVFQPRVNKPLPGGRLGEHADNPIKIELHTKIAEPLPVVTTDITQYLWPRVVHPGLNPYPSPVSLMMHLLLHAAGNIRARALRLIQLHDIALLAACLNGEDWEELLAARPDDRTLWWALAPLMLTVRYYAAAVPLDLIARVGEDCPWLLCKRARRQRLVDVSWSNIRIEAFPGVEWSRTAREALEFMGSRIWPSREARIELKEGAAQIPDSSTIPWYGLSHGTRIMRWVFSRPPRVQTLLSVRAALAVDP